MYEPPRIWEIDRMLRERREAKQAQARHLEECKKTYKTLFEQLGISYREMGKAEISAYRKQWIATFAPSCADKRKIKELCLSSRRYTPFLWHLFSYEFLSSVEEASSDFDRSDKSSCVFISNLDEIGFVLKGAERLTAEIIENESNGFIDVTISDEALTWTYCKTHEEMCGPYYYAR